MRRITVVLLSAALLGACGPDPASGPAGAPAAQTPVGSASEVTPEALRFTAPLVGGGTLDASTLADRPTVFWFWAPG